MSTRASVASVALVAACWPLLLLADEALVAATFSKAAIYIASPDFIHDPVVRHFSPEELAVLDEHQVDLSAIIQYKTGHTVGGALLAAHFKLEEHVPKFRWLLLQPGTVYGWEGPDYESEEDYLTDSQFVFHSVYLNAIEELTGLPIYEAIQPTQAEIDELFRILGNRSSEHYYWAQWLARKLLLLESPE